MDIINQTKALAPRVRETVGGSTPVAGTNTRDLGAVYPQITTFALEYSEFVVLKSATLFILYIKYEFFFFLK